MPRDKNHCICFNELVAGQKDMLWAIEPHTSAKHDILRKYLDAWLPILGKFNQKTVYIDGFSGPGEYRDGEPGSPIIALEAASCHQAKLAANSCLSSLKNGQTALHTLRAVSPPCGSRHNSGYMSNKA